MEKLIYSCMTNSISDPRILLLAASIREFAGSLSDCPIWIIYQETRKEISPKIKMRLKNLNIEIIPFTGDVEILKFPFAGLALAAATAESHAKDKTSLLTWMLPDTLVINEPKDFLLDDRKKLGYRPVHHTLVGSIYDKPLDPFWETIFRKCDISNDKFFPMKTHVDHNTLRPYFNAGFLTVRPKEGLLSAWWDFFKSHYRDKEFKIFYDQNELYSIFIHQAILAGVILSKLERQELQELPFSYNYPLHLYSECPNEFKPQNINDLITVRYEQPEWFERVPIQDPLKSWLRDQLKLNTEEKTDRQNNSFKKIKFGKVPLVYPVPIVLAGALVNGRPNFETLGDVAIMGINPAIVCISSGQTHHTNIGILEHRAFSINFPQTKLLSEVDYLGVVSGRDVDKSKFFEVFYGELGNVPMIRECPVNLECRVLKEMSIQHRQIFIAEVVQAYVNEEFVTEEEGHRKIVGMKKLDPIIYALDNQYYKIGKKIGTGYQEYKKLEHE